jgi:hypothetical protein
MKSISGQMRGLILGLTAMLVGFPLLGWITFVTVMVPVGHSDFRANYTAGHMLRTGKPLYDYSAELDAQNQFVSREELALPFIHPAYEALVYVPLSLLPYRSAYWLWFGINLALLVLVYYLLRPELDTLSAIAPSLPVATLFAYLPLGTCLVLGQDSVLLLLLLAAAFSLLRNERLLLAGVCLGAGAFRFQIVLPIVLCFAVWRRWRLVVGFLASSIPAAIISIALAGFMPYVKTLQGLAANVPQLHQSVEKMPTLRGLIQSLGGGAWLIGLISLLVLLITFLAGRNFEVRQQLALAISAASLVSYHACIHDLSILFIPCGLLLAGSNRDLLIAGVVFFSPALLIFAPNHFYLAVAGSVLLFAYLLRRTSQTATVVGALERTLAPAAN